MNIYDYHKLFILTEMVGLEPWNEDLREGTILYRVSDKIVYAHRGNQTIADINNLFKFTVIDILKSALRPISEAEVKNFDLIKEKAAEALKDCKTSDFIFFHKL